MPSNTAIVLKFKLTDEVRNSLINIEKGINRINNDWKNLTQNLDLCDINLVLYKCEREELDNTNYFITNDLLDALVVNNLYKEKTYRKSL